MALAVVRLFSTALKFSDTHIYNTVAKSLLVQMHQMKYECNIQGTAHNGILLCNSIYCNMSRLKVFLHYVRKMFVNDYQVLTYPRGNKQLLFN